jgi:hypothetical protein
VAATFPHRRVSNHGKEWEGDRRSWFKRSCLPPEAEVLGIEKFRWVDIIEEGFSRRIAFLRMALPGFCGSIICGGFDTDTEQRRPSGDRRLAAAILQPQSGPVCPGRRLPSAGRRWAVDAEAALM